MADPLVEVVVRVYADFADRATLAEVLAVVARARNDLDTPSAAALPELVERLARQRLADAVAYPVTTNSSAQDDRLAEPTGETGSALRIMRSLRTPH
jgi:hypothetical protein